MIRHTAWFALIAALGLCLPASSEITIQSSWNLGETAVGADGSNATDGELNNFNNSAGTVINTASPSGVNSSTAYATTNGVNFQGLWMFGGGSNDQTVPSDNWGVQFMVRSNSSIATGDFRAVFGMAEGVSGGLVIEAANVGGTVFWDVNRQGIANYIIPRNLLATVTPNWTALALVKSGGTTSFYVNGQLAGSNAAAINTSGLLAFGFQQNVGTKHLAGDFDEASFFTFAPGAFNPTIDLIKVEQPGLIAPLTASGTSNGIASTLTVPIGNGAAVPYTITGASYSGPNLSDFSSSTVTPVVVPAGGSTDFLVNVIPTAGGSRTATLTLVTNDPSNPSFEVDLSVEVSDPEIVIEPSLNFGDSPTLPGSVVDEIIVDNLGDATHLTVGSPVISGPGAAAFSVSSLPSPIAPGAFGTVGVTFNPLAAGFHSASLQLSTNDPFAPLVTVQLSGEVTGSLIQGVTVAGVSSGLTAFGRDASNSVNGSGMKGLGSVGSTHGTGENGVAWTTHGNIIEPNDLDPQVTCDLGAVYQVTKIREWGYNDPTVNGFLGTPARIFGPNLVEVFTSIDNVTFSSAGTINFSLAPGTAGYLGSDIAVSLPAARYIRFDIKSNHDGAIFDGTGASPGVADARSLTGLSEVRFEGTPVAGTPFEIWLDSFALAGADRLPDADPERDGVSNIIEYVTGGNPNVADTGNLPNGEVIGDNLVVSFDRPDSVSGVAIRFEAGVNLSSWPDIFTVGSSPEISILSNGSSPDTITLTLPRAGNPRRFTRLVAELVP